LWAFLHFEAVPEVVFGTVQNYLDQCLPALARWHGLQKSRVTNDLKSASDAKNGEAPDARIEELATKNHKKTRSLNHRLIGSSTLALDIGLSDFSPGLDQNILILNHESSNKQT